MYSVNPTKFPETKPSPNALESVIEEEEEEENSPRVKYQEIFNKGKFQKCIFEE